MVEHACNLSFQEAEAGGLKVKGKKTAWYSI
jgi:hypothetical protein